MKDQKPGPHRRALEVTLTADPELTDPIYSGVIALARSLADELDSQGDKPQTRTQATYAGLLGALGRIVRDAREIRRKERVAPELKASRLALIKTQSQTAMKEAS